MPTIQGRCGSKTTFCEIVAMRIRAKAQGIGQRERLHNPPGPMLISMSSGFRGSGARRPRSRRSGGRAWSGDWAFVGMC